MINKCSIEKNPTIKHNQILYTYGLILRYLAATLSAYYLHSKYIDDKVNRCIITDLRRPTYGNLLSFLRFCIKSQQIQWSLLNPLIQNLKKLFKRKNSQLIGIENSIPILDAFISYRNNIIHGCTEISEINAKIALIPLEELLSNILNSLDVLKNFHISFTNEFNLEIDSELISFSPFAQEDDSNFIGLLEGFDSRKEILRFVSINKVWESKSQWHILENLLKKRGLLPYSWDEVTLKWLKQRSLAIIPENFTLIQNEIFNDNIIEKIKLCFDNNRIKSSDPTLLTIALTSLNNKINFIITPDTIIWNMDPYEGISQLIGIKQNIKDLPENHPLEILLKSINIFIVSQWQNDNIPNWKILENDFSDLKIFYVSKSSQHSQGYVFSESLIKELFNLITKYNKIDITWDKLPSNLLTWIDDIEKINFIVEHWGTFDKSSLDPLLIWKKYLDTNIAIVQKSSIIEDFITCCNKPSDIIDKQSFSLLRDIGILHYSTEGIPIFVNEWARAVLYWYALEYSTGRQNRRVIDNPPNLVSIEIGKVIFLANKKKEIDFSKNSKGLSILIAYCILKNEDMGNFHEKPLDNITSACIYLVNWGYPEIVDKLLCEFLDSIKYLDSDIKNLLNIAIAVRTHGSASLAYSIYKNISTNNTAYGIRAKHEMAGILRDRGQGNDRDIATNIYQSILDNNSLDHEQYIRTSCGAAENLYLNNKYKDAIELLNNTLKEARDSRLKALIYHRLASAYAYYGDYEDAYKNSSMALLFFSNKFSGAFASRCLDTHSRILKHLDFSKEAIEYAEKSISIKRALGDRRGLQISLLSLSDLLKRTNIPKANSMAKEALNLAKKSGDITGQLLAYKRLININKKNIKIVEYYKKKIDEIQLRGVK